MIKHILHILLITPIFGFAQGVIEGRIVDGEFNDVLPFANIQLMQISPFQVVVGTTSDFDGKFLFDELSEGEYELEVSLWVMSPKKLLTSK